MIIKDETELLAMIRASNYDAFNEMHNQFWKPLYIHALKKTGSKDDAFDMVQDLFLELWEKRERIPVITAPLKFYLRGTLVFKLARYYRTKGFQEKHQKNFEEFLKQHLATDFNADNLVLREEELLHEGLIQVIDSTIEDMPGKMKTIFVMSRSGKYSISEISEMLNLSPQTVKNQVNNAFLRLRKATADHSLTTTQIAILTWLTIS